MSSILKIKMCKAQHEKCLKRTCGPCGAEICEILMLTKNKLNIVLKVCFTNFPYCKYTLHINRPNSHSKNFHINMLHSLCMNVS